MRTDPFRIAAVGGLLVALTALLWACGKSTSITPPTAVPTLVSLAVSGPDSVAPGTTAQLTAVATLSDGSTQDVTRVATWSSDQQGVLRVSSTGLITAAAALGEAHILVRDQARTVTKDILVLPSGTYRVTGRVLDQGTGLAAATVAATISGNVVATTQTDSGGEYALFGLAGAVSLQVSELGYATQVRSLMVTSSVAVDDITLVEVVPSADISGLWNVTFSVDPFCANALPADVRQRTFTATIAEQGTHFTAQLSSTATPSAATVTDGRVIGSAFSLDLPTNYYGFAGDLVEVIAAARSLVIFGIVTGTVTGPTLQASWSGELLYYDAPAPVPFPTLMCAGANGTATFQRPSNTSAARRIRH